MAIVPNSARILCFYNGSSYYATHFHTNCNAGGSFRLIVCDPSNYANLYVPLGYMATGGVTSRPIRVRVTNGGDIQCMQDILPVPVIYFCTDTGGTYGQCKKVQVCCIYMNNKVTTYNCINFYVREPGSTYWRFIATMPRCGQCINTGCWYICCAQGLCLVCSQFKADLIYGNNRVASYCTSNFPVCGGLGWRRLQTSTFGNSEYWGNPL